MEVSVSLRPTLPAFLGLLLALQRRLGALPLRAWTRDTLLLTLATVLASGVAWLLAERVAWPSGIVGLALQCGLGGGFGLVIYGLVAGLAGVPEARQLISGMARRLPGKA